MLRGSVLEGGGKRANGRERNGGHTLNLVLESRWYSSQIFVISMEY
jgi:hypothetical protein